MAGGAGSRLPQQSMGPGPVARFPLAEKQKRHGAPMLTSRTLSEICKEKSKIGALEHSDAPCSLS